MARSRSQLKTYVLDTNVLIHDPNAILNFEEHQVVIPITVLEELDRLKTGKSSIAADCRQAIRLIDKLLGDATPKEIEKGVPIVRVAKGQPLGTISILMDLEGTHQVQLPETLNDNKIINALVTLQSKHKSRPTILVSKDINMRLKARACGVEAEDYHTDQLIDDIDLLPKGYQEFNHSFWDNINKVETLQKDGLTEHVIPRLPELKDLNRNDFIIDEQGFVGRVSEFRDDHMVVRDLSRDKLLQQEAWGLTPRDIYQAVALQLLLDPDIHLVNLTGAAGSGKTILALAAAIEMTVASKRYKRIIVTRSTQGLDEDIGFLPGTEAEKMEPWLGAITDNLEALHHDDENMSASVEYILQKVPIQFKSLNYIRGRSFQHSLIVIDECQNLTPHQVKTIITRAGNGSKVVCLGNLAQIDTPYLNAPSSGLTYMTERFRGFKHGAHVHLRGVPRSALAEFAEANL
ncbi:MULTISPECIES: PhoH family protein [unclassified Hahella]|uniref:PhoH family protein n=1 Tax=unclassified Hahella TaxID=2624107 RepID=UPI001C1E9B10|nr:MULTISPECIES: PhoH family protein [unclassified Hahella]MBU6954929.1 PhoH family protein [Hahella sp. HN01]MDG9669555.1 PhoH family protein [Hahella sp. CR1]